MRLTTSQHQAIKKYFLEVFKEGQIYLFGSRVDEGKRGGDIDLYIQTSDRQNLMHKKLDFLVKLKKEIGLHRSIDKVAMKEGI